LRNILDRARARDILIDVLINNIIF